MTPIYVLSGGPGSEHEVSIRSGETILGAIRQSGRSAKAAILGKDGIWAIPEYGEGARLGSAAFFDMLVREKAFAFPIIHGTYGEDGTLARELESRDIPFAGSGSEALELTIDKQKTGEWLEIGGIRTPKSYVIDSIAQIADLDTGYPCIVKPRDEWSSVSLYKPENAEELARVLETELAHRNDMLVQEFVRWREFTCGVIEGAEGIRALVPTEIILTKSGLFDYEAKYTVGWCAEVTPAEVQEELAKRIGELAIRVHERCGCRDFSRTDMILNERWELVVLEINPLPGMTGTSLVPQALACMGISLPEFVSGICGRHG